MSRGRTAKPPELEDHYGEWTPYLHPLQMLHKRGKNSFLHRWMIPVECSCGRKSIVDYQNLKNGKSQKCIYCGEVEAGSRIGATMKKRKAFFEAFGEQKTLAEWSKDSRCKVSLQKLSYRLRCTDMEIERALTEKDARHGRHKLSPEQAVEVFKRALHGEKGFELAQEFGISSPTVTHILEGKVYAIATENARNEALGYFCNDNDLLVQSACGRKRLPLPGETFGCWTVRDKPFRKKIKKHKEWLIPAECECGNRALLKFYCLVHGNVRCVKCKSKGTLVEKKGTHKTERKS